MKIEINLLNEPSIYDLQLKIVNQYINDNTEYIENYNCFGELITSEMENKVIFYSIPKIRETNKDQGVLSFLKGNYRKFWLHCKRTKKGIYKFNLRNA